MQGLRQHDQPQGLPAVQPQRQPGRPLAGADGGDAGLHRLAQIGGVDQRQRQHHGEHAGDIHAKQDGQQEIAPEDQHQHRYGAQQRHQRAQRAARAGSAHHQGDAAGQAQQAGQHAGGGADGQGQQQAAGFAVGQIAPQQIIEIVLNHRRHHRGALHAGSPRWLSAWVSSTSSR